MTTDTPLMPAHVSPDLPPTSGQAGSTQGAGVNPPDRRYKLTAHDVLEMRARYASSRVSYRAIAKEYGICMAAARHAIVGITWTELPGAFTPQRAPAPKKSHRMPWAKLKPYMMAYRQRFPERHAARIAVANAVHRGDLIPQPCEKCGEPKTQAHHDDYSKPLEVRWLCRKHHDEHHKQAAVSLPYVADYSI